MKGKIINFVKKYKAYFYILVFNVVLYLIYMLTTGYFLLDLAKFMYPEYKGSGLEGFGLLFQAGLVVLIIYSIISALLMLLITRKWRYMVAAFALFIAVFQGHLVVLQIRDEFIRYQYSSKFHKVFDPAVKKAEEAKIEIITFNEQGIRDEEGYLHELRVTLTVQSNTDITILDPFRACALGFHASFNDQRCFYEIPGDETSSKTYQIIKGKNKIEKVFVMDKKGYDFFFIRKDDQIPFIVSTGFSVYYREESGEESGVGLENVTDLTNTTKPPRLNFSSDAILFQTKPYKIRFID